MYTNIEFLDTEPIENVITAMHFEMDKVIFFGYDEVINEYRKQTEDFLRGKCKVEKVEFYPVSKKSLNKVVNSMKNVLDKEKKEQNRIFFDLTGGESLILVAFGMLCESYGAQMHEYDILNDKLIEMDKESEGRISNVANPKTFELTLDKYIELRGAKINHRLDKDLVNVNDEEFMSRVRELWKLMVKYKQNWNYYTGLIQRNFKTDTLEASNTLPKSVAYDFEEFKNFISDLAEAGVIVNYDAKDIGKMKERVQFSFSYASQALKDCLMKSGTTLELHVYDEMKSSSFHCYESIHIDWDGVIYGDTKKDVTNEIDVLCITGNVPFFISCKGGNLSGDAMREAMYELETVTKYFGGKYAKKVLATLHPVTGVFAKRADEMGIELWCCGEEGECQ